MRVLMILNQNTKEIRVLVRLKERRMKDRIVALLEDDRRREAFELLWAKAEVEAYFPLGARPSKRIRPDVTLFEDMCG